MTINFLKYIANITVNKKDDENLIVNDNIDYKTLSYIEYHQIASNLHYFKDRVKINYPNINAEILHKCQEQFLQNLSRNLVYADFLKNSSPPEFVIAKGLASASLLYPHDAVRTSHDLDIFIKTEDYDPWCHFLKEKNFYKYGNISDKFPDKIIQKYNFAQHFINEDNKLAIDLHLNISNKMHPFQFEMEEFWNNLQPLDYEGLALKTFANEYLIIYYLYHAFKHYYFKLVWFIDLYLLFKKRPYDEEKVLQLIKKYHLEKIFGLYLAISKEIFSDCGLRQNSYLADHFSPLNHKTINARTVLAGEFFSANTTNRLFLPTQYLPKPTQKIKYLWQQLFPPKEILPEFYNQSNKMSWIVYMLSRLKKIHRLEKFQ